MEWEAELARRGVVKAVKYAAKAAEVTARSVEKSKAAVEEVRKMKTNSRRT